jgi:hypothetical protein
MKKNNNLIGAGLGLAVLGGVTDNKAVSSLGAGLFAVGVVKKALKNKGKRR